MLEPCQGRGLDPFDGIEVVALGAASESENRTIAKNLLEGT